MTNIEALCAQVHEGDDSAAQVLTDVLLETGGSAPALRGVVHLITRKATNRKGFKRDARPYCGVFAYVVAGESIELFGTRHPSYTDRDERAWTLTRYDGKECTSVKRGAVGFYFSHRFVIGGEAVTGSYNLTYTGTIKSITAKRVAVGKDNGTSKLKSFNFETFCSWNWDADFADIHRRNSDAMMYL